jgi:hypothetical protein
MGNGKEELIIEFQKLDPDRIIKDTEFILIIRDGLIKKYRVMDTEEKLLKHLSKQMNYEEDKMGILVTFECNNISGTFNNMMFLKKFKIDSYSNSKIDDFWGVNFNRCEFLQDIELLGGDYKRIKINDSVVRQSFYIRFINCEKIRINNVIVKENVVVENSEFGKFYVNASRFEENLLFQEVNILNDFTLDKVKGEKELCFLDCRFEGLSKLELNINGELNFSQCSFYKKSEINFDDINGKFSLYKTNFSDKCYLEYELLENKKYKPLIFQDNFKKTKWNFLIVSDIYKSSGRTEQYLETLYYFKKYERLERKNKNRYKLSLLDYLIEITTKYYTSWKRTLVSMGCIILVFFLLYSSFPNLLICKDIQIDSKDLFRTVFEMYQDSKFDFNFLLSKFGNTLYFTIITFTTVGYGDITPLNWMKMAVGLESFLGIFFTSSFVVSLSRRFM